MALKAKKAGRFRGGTGEVEYDNRASPVPLEIRRGNGGTLIVPAGEVFRARTYTCPHGNHRVVILESRTRPRAVCPRCNYIICDQCAQANFCTIIDDLVDLHLARPGSVRVGRDGALVAERRLLEVRRPF